MKVLGLLKSLSRFLPGRSRFPSRVISFHSLPLEVLYTLFTHIPPDELINLCRTGNQMRHKVRNYLRTPLFIYQFTKTVFPFLHEHSREEKSKTFTMFARLIRVGHVDMKRSICAQFVIEMYMKTPESIQRCYYDWGVFFAELLNGWTQSEEMHFLHHFFAETGELKEGVRVLQSAEPLVAERLHLRRLILGYFLKLPWDACEHTLLRFRLSAILHIFSFFYSARDSLDQSLLLLLGSPIGTAVDGTEFIDFSQIHMKVVERTDAIKTVLGNLPDLVAELLYTVELELFELRWTHLRVFRFIENLTTTPEQWTLSTYSAFLLSSSELATLAISTRAINQKILEAGHTLYFLIEFAVTMRMNAFASLRPTVQTMLKHCPPASCLAVIRSAFVHAHHHFTQHVLPENFEENFADVGIDLVRHSLELNSVMSEIGRSIVG